MRVPRLLHILPFILLGLFIAACQPSGSTLPLKPCKVGGLDARCGFLKVFENREAQTGRTIDLQVTVFPAKNSPALPDPLFYLAGGPGGGGSQFVGTALSQFAEINQTRDLVYVDQRGTGGSNPLVCPQPKAGENDEAAFQRCLANLPGDPRFYTTTLSMDDVDDVRQALGYEKINLYGLSYGVSAAQVYLNRHPESVRAVILDHGSLLQIPFIDHWARSSQAALDRLFERCGSDPACRQAYPNLKAEFQTLFQQLEQPTGSGLFDPETIKEVTFNRVNFGSTVHYLLMDAATAVQLPALIHQAAGGDWSGLAKAAMTAAKAPSEQLKTMVMTLEILCYEPWAGGSLEAVQRLGQGSYYLDTLTTTLGFLKARCSQLPNPGRLAEHGPALPSPVPMLILTGELDPQDNLDLMAGAQELWPDSRLVLQPGVSHNFTPTPCWNHLMSEFIRRGSAQDLPLACVQENQLPLFK